MPNMMPLTDEKLTQQGFYRCKSCGHPLYKTYKTMREEQGLDPNLCNDCSNQLVSKALTIDTKSNKDCGCPNKTNSSFLPEPLSKKHIAAQVEHLADYLTKNGSSKYIISKGRVIPKSEFDKDFPEPLGFKERKKALIMDYTGVLNNINW